MTKRPKPTDEPPHEFALRLRELRGEEDLSIRDLAVLACVSEASIWKWEHGYNEPQSRLLPALAQALGVPVHSLVAPPGADEPLVVQPSVEAQEATDPAVSEQHEALANVIAQAKQMIAKVAGHPPEKIVIRLDF